MRGVTGVSNMIRIGSDAAAQDIGNQISEALQRHADREAKHIAIRVHEGTVTLTS
jgi:hyperosmotically inducible protein